MSKSHGRRRGRLEKSVEEKNTEPSVGSHGINLYRAVLNNIIIMNYVEVTHFCLFVCFEKALKVDMFRTYSSQFLSFVVFALFRRFQGYRVRWTCSGQ